jgi:Ca2+-binding RTX toxin-like protein
VPAAQIGDGNTGLMLLRNADDLIFGKPAALHLWSFRLGQSLTQTGLSKGGYVNTLIDGAGTDTFVLVPGSWSSDLILDFVVFVDRVEIDSLLFRSGLAPGALDPELFVSNTTGEAGDLDNRFIYNTRTRELTFDSNVSDAGGDRIIAVFEGLPVLVADDFVTV